MDTYISKYWPILIGIIAMLFLVYGTLSESGSQIQKILFVVGAPMLGLTAYFSKQKMFTILQLVATLGAVLAFFPGLSAEFKYLLMGAAAIFGLIYLERAKCFENSKLELIGALGLISIAVGFATDSLTSPFLFGIFLGLGGILVALYSAIQFFNYKIKIALIWLVLNILFSINPLLLIFRLTSQA